VPSNAFSGEDTYHGELTTDNPGLSSWGQWNTIPNPDGARYLRFVLVEAYLDDSNTYATCGEIEFKAAMAVLQIKIPSVASSADTILNLWYDSTHADNTTYIGDTGDTAAQNVWDTSIFGARYNLRQDPSGGADCILDSTSNEYHGTPTGMVAGDQKGGYLTFSAGKYISVGAIDFGNIYAESILVKNFDGTSSDYGAALSHYNSNTERRAWWALPSTNDPSYGTLAVNIAPTADHESDTWEFFTATTDGADLELFVNGISDNTSTGNIATDYAADGSFYIGAYRYNTALTPMAGDLSEARVYVAAISAAWEKATYHSLADSLVVLSVPSASSPVRAILDQSYDLSAALLRALLDQSYHLTLAQRAILEQVYGLRMLAVFAQPYGDMPVYRAVLDQYYGDNPLMRRLFEQDYGDAYKYRAALDQYWNMPEALRAIFEQRYSISEAQIRALCDQGYDLQDRDLLRTTLDQLYVLAAGEALVQVSDTSVTCDGVTHTSAYNIHCEQDESLFYMAGDLQLADEAEYLQYVAFESEVVITVDGDEYNFIPEYPRRGRNPGKNTFIVPLVSETVLLDSPHNKIETEGDLTGMASVLAASLASPFTVHWQLVDWFIPAGVLSGTGEPAISISVIKKIVAAAGGVVQTNPAGELICRPEYPVSVNNWESAAPDIELTDQDDFFQITPNPAQRPGYNMFLITDQSLDGDDGLTMEIIKESKTRNKIRVRMVPWDDGVRINMLHSGGSWVGIVAQGVVVDTIEAEQIEIVAGGGRLSKPVYQYLSHDYREAELGDPVLSESGDVTTPTDGNSLIDITYLDRYWSFRGTDAEIENVQFYPEVIEL